MAVKPLIRSRFPAKKTFGETFGDATGVSALSYRRTLSLQPRSQVSAFSPAFYLRTFGFFSSRPYKKIVQAEARAGRIGRFRVTVAVDCKALPVVASGFFTLVLLRLSLLDLGLLTYPNQITGKVISKLGSNGGSGFSHFLDDGIESHGVESKSSGV
jgi:hypothetical protein